MSDWKLRIELGAKQDIREGFDYYKQEAGVDVARRFRDVVRAGMATAFEATRSSSLPWGTRSESPATIADESKKACRSAGLSLIWLPEDVCHTPLA